MNKLSDELNRSQGDKIFTLWDKDTFHIDKLNRTELNVTQIINHNHNTILVNSESNKIQYKVKLAWGNHKGVLNPRFMVAFKRYN